ncbi:MULTISPECIES: hypothetical protein [unclassified Burkholderia]|uniref:hypothetical protein n=1 Tax=unclassified Burkholderia TaxID=2613784 RepID=UPI000F5843F7|nr:MULTISPECIES: hypothetical protein [unclassified Burkholderia]
MGNASPELSEKFVHEFAWLYVTQYKTTLRPEDNLTYLSKNALDSFKWVDQHADVAKLFCSYVEQMKHDKWLDDHSIRVYGDGSIATPIEHERELAEKYLIEGASIAASNIFGAFGMYMAKLNYPNDPEMQLKVAHLTSTLGESFFAAGETMHAFHEYHDFRPGDRYEHLHAPGQHDHNDRPSMEPVGHDLPGHQTYYPEPAESREGVSENTPTSDHEHEDTFARDHLVSGTGSSPASKSVPDVASAVGGTSSDSGRHCLGEATQGTYTPANANMTDRHGAAIHAGDYHPAHPTQHQCPPADANAAGHHGGTTDASGSKPGESTQGTYTPANANMTDRHGAAIHAGDYHPAHPTQHQCPPADANAAGHHGGTTDASGSKPGESTQGTYTPANANMTDRHGAAIHAGDYHPAHPTQHQCPPADANAAGNHGGTTDAHTATSANQTDHDSVQTHAGDCVPGH